ncbi:OB-fold nucleic acid binding domain-containing protein [Nanoarchaeota archaeon]
MLQRQTAHKIQAGEILVGKPIFDGDRFSALDHSGTRVSRVNLLGNIIDKYVNQEKRYCTLTLDDGSGQIRLKGFSDQFDLLNSPEIGNTVRVIGLLRFFNNELYIMPEIIKAVDPKWLHVRRLELGGQKGTEPPVLTVEHPTNITPTPTKVPQQETVQLTQEKIGGTEEKTEEKKIESPKLKILDIIRTKKEAELNELMVSVKVTQDELNTIINELITEGEIYELKPGHLCSVN